MNPGWVSVCTAAGRSPAGADAVIHSSVMSSCGAHAGQRGDRGDQPVLRAAVHPDLAPGDQPGHQVGERLEPVAGQPPGRAAQPRHALDDDPPVRAELDVRAHPLQEQRELDHLGFGGRVAQHRLALGQHRGQQHRLGRAHARVRQVDPRAVQPRRPRDDPGRARLDLGAEGAQRRDVEVDRPPPDRVAADQRDERLPGPVQQRPEHQDRDPVQPGERLRHPRLAPRGRRRDRDVAAGPADLVPDGLQHRGRDVDVADLRRVADRARPVAQHRRDHVLGHRVLRPAHLDVAAQRPRRFHLPGFRHADHSRRTQ